MKKLNVTWICHFSNQQVRNKIPLSKQKLLNMIRRIFAKGLKPPDADSAPWITNQIAEFEKFDNVELHIIAPFAAMKPMTFEFEMNGIHYHFFRPFISFTSNKFITHYIKPKKRLYWQSKYFVKKFLNVIKPDIINLIGAENPYYSITALSVNNIPLYVSLQTILSTPFNEEYNYKVDKFSISVESRIILKFSYFGTDSKLYNDCVKKINPNAIVFEYKFPKQRPPEIEKIPIEFDFVFFASRISQEKGIEDTIDALSRIKYSGREAKLNIIGSCKRGYKIYLEEKIKSLGLNDNIVFTEYFPLHSDMFKQVKKSAIAVLPSKIDVIAGTIAEAMFLGLPVISYKTTGTPVLNEECESILLSEIGDIDSLAKNMLLLLDSPELRKKLVINAKYVIDKRYNNAEIAEKLVADYRAIVDHYRYKTTIPENLLFNIDKFPVY